MYNVSDNNIMHGFITFQFSFYLSLKILKYFHYYETHPPHLAEEATAGIDNDWHTFSDKEVHLSLGLTTIIVSAGFCNNCTQGSFEVALSKSHVISHNYFNEWPHVLVIRIQWQ